jgi:hypothetical protein
MEIPIGITPEIISTLENNDVFVFGSNLAGRHGGGAARTALRWGAVMGQGVGLQGQTYAIPTMFDTTEEIRPYVIEFIAFAKNHPEYRFLVTKIGCGIAGFTVTEMAELFRPVVIGHIQNIYLPNEFVQALVTGDSHKEG